jgi:transposase
MLKLHHNTTKKLLKLKRAAEQSKEYRVAKRIHAILLNNSGHSSGSVAKLLHSPRSIISQWLKNYECFGYEALLEGYRSGRPKGLDEKQEEQFCDILDSGPVAYGYLSGVWTSPMIKKVIEEEFGLSYHPGHIRKILYSLNYSMQRPKRVLANADPEKQNKWRRYTYPNIKKKSSSSKISNSIRR